MVCTSLQATCYTAGGLTGLRYVRGVGACLVWRPLAMTVYICPCQSWCQVMNQVWSPRPSEKVWFKDVDLAFSVSCLLAIGSCTLILLQGTWKEGKQMTTSEQQQGRRATVEGVWEMTVKFLHLRDHMVGREPRGRQSALCPTQVRTGPITHGLFSRQYRTINISPLLHSFLSDIFFLLAYYSIRIVRETYKMC